MKRLYIKEEEEEEEEKGLLKKKKKEREREREREREKNTHRGIIERVTGRTKHCCWLVAAVSGWRDLALKILCVQQDRTRKRRLSRRRTKLQEGAQN